MKKRLDEVKSDELSCGKVERLCLKRGELRGGKWKSASGRLGAASAPFCHPFWLAAFWNLISDPSYSGNLKTMIRKPLDSLSICILLRDLSQHTHENHNCYASSFFAISSTILQPLNIVALASLLHSQRWSERETECIFASAHVPLMISPPATATSSPCLRSRAFVIDSFLSLSLRLCGSRALHQG